MPVESKFSILGVDVKKQTPTVAEWTQKWGEETLRAEATNNVWYRSTAAEIRDLFLHGRPEEKNEKGEVVVAARPGFDDLTGIKRLTKTVTLQSKNPDGSAKTTEVYNETEQKFFNRAISELATKAVAEGKHPNPEAAEAALLAQYQPLLQECVDLVDFDASKPPPGEKKAKGLPQAFINAAQQAIDKGNAQKLAKFLSKQIGSPVGKTENGSFVVTVQELAEAMKKDDERIRAARAAELKAMIG